MRLSKIAEEIGGSLLGADAQVASIRSLATATPQDLTIVFDKAHLKLAKACSAKAVVSFTKEVDFSSVILVSSPRKIFAKLLSLFEEKDRRVGISQSVAIAENVMLGSRLYIEEFVKIDEGCVIGDDVRLYSGVKIGRGVTIGDGSVLYPNVVIYDHTQIGRGCILHGGCIIGADGFGFEPDDKKEWMKIPQIARVIIGDSVEIGAGSCVDRGAIQDTIIGKGTKIDNLVQIGHNSQIGEHNVFSAMVAIGGSTSVKDHTLWGGQSGSAGHLTVGQGVTVMSRAGLTKDISDHDTVQGFPAQNYKVEWREKAILRRLARKKGRENDSEKEQKT